MPTFAPPRLLATRADLTAYLNPHSRGIDESALYDRLLDAASRRVEEYTDRVWLPDPAYVTESPIVDTAPAVTVTIGPDRIDYGPFPQPALAAWAAWARVPDVRAMTAVTVDDGALATSEWALDARPGQPAHAMRLSRGPSRELEITGRFGFANVPADVREATVVLAARAVYERNARLADVSQDPEGGVASYFRQIPPTVAATLDRYRIGGL